MSEEASFNYGKPVLQARKLGKIYARKPIDLRRKLARSAWGTLFNLTKKKRKSVSGSQFWAVNDVSFELARGEALGIIGLNGSGKTTLLRMLAGQIPLDTGEIVIDGKSAAMIDLQAGFQSKSSGFDNIFLRAAALGLTRQQALERVDEIIEFSELGDAIDAPMASYSSGMKMRLAFSIMLLVSPDVLLIDEVLAVGDFRFRQKCLSKVREMRDRSAFVFVSHSMADVARFCDRVIVIHNGSAVFEGAPDEAIEVYQNIDPRTPPGDGESKLALAMGSVYENKSALHKVEHYWCDANGQRVDEVEFDRAFGMRVVFRSNIDFRNLIVGIPVWAMNTHYNTGLSTQISSAKFDIKKGEDVHLFLEVEGGYLNPGVIKSMLTILDGPEFLYRKQNPDLHILSAPHPTWGAVTVPHSWRKLNQSEFGDPKLNSLKK